MYQKKFTEFFFWKKIKFSRSLSHILFRSQSNSTGPTATPPSRVNSNQHWTPSISSITNITIITIKIKLAFTSDLPWWRLSRSLTEDNTLYHHSKAPCRSRNFATLASPPNSIYHCCQFFPELDNNPCLRLLNCIFDYHWSNFWPSWCCPIDSMKKDCGRQPITSSPLLFAGHHPLLWFEQPPPIPCWDHPSPLSSPASSWLHRDHIDMMPLQSYSRRPIGAHNRSLSISDSSSLDCG